MVNRHIITYIFELINSFLGFLRENWPGILLVVAIHQTDIAECLHIVITEVVCRFGVLSGGKVADAALAVMIDDLKGICCCDQGEIPSCPGQFVLDGVVEELPVESPDEGLGGLLAA